MRSARAPDARGATSEASRGAVVGDVFLKIYGFWKFQKFAKLWADLSPGYCSSAKTALILIQVSLFGVAC